MHAMLEKVEGTMIERHLGESASSSQRSPSYENNNGEVAAQGHTIRIARDFEDMAKVFALRASAYFDNAEHLYSKHFDGNDFSSTHLLGYIDGEPVATVRIRYFANFTRIERLTVRPTHRKSRIAFRLAKASFDFCKDKGYRELRGVAREELVPFWATLGFRIDDTKEPIFIYGLPHYEMVLNCEQPETAVDATSHPLVLLRPEGRWSEQGFHETHNATKPQAIVPTMQTARGRRPRDIAIGLRDKGAEAEQNPLVGPSASRHAHSDAPQRPIG